MVRAVNTTSEIGNTYVVVKIHVAKMRSKLRDQYLEEQWILCDVLPRFPFKAEKLISSAAVSDAD